MMTKINRKPTAKDLREFGLVILIGFGLVGGLAWHKGHASHAVWIWSVSGAIGCLALVLPTLAKPFYWLWMGLGMAIGAVTSRIVLTLIFFGVLTPIAVLFRLRRRDELRLRRPDLPSYWNDHPEIPKDNYGHTF